MMKSLPILSFHYLVIKLGLGDSNGIGDGTNMSLLTFCFDENKKISTITKINPRPAKAKFFIKYYAVYEIFLEAVNYLRYNHLR